MSTYLSAARAFAAQVRALPDDLSGPGLGDWDLRALAGHTSRSLVTVITYLQQPVDDVAVESAAAYFALLGSSGVTAGEEVTARGVAAGEAMGADPAAYVDGLLDRVTADLAAVDGDPVITTAAGGMRLSDYLPTRTFELVVHGLDIASATSSSWTPPPDALAEAVSLAAEVAVLTGSGVDLLRLATGRSTAGISIV
ncbi:maleylpyruvate isomerase N-terminal domain-containing protein [Nocardioides sp. CN2-186]|uniref:maleylpyruvate isomerase N-terminal domain-containing protein n=1 Tax=Nocardioides tweenelious TaxID=3156607 RepID=UPI0032B4641C